MLNTTTYTKIFLRENNIAVTDTNVNEYRGRWFQNGRKDSMDMRLSENGLIMLRTLDIEFYQVKFDDNSKGNLRVVGYMNKYVKNPFYLTDDAIYFTNKKEATELTLYSGDAVQWAQSKGG